MRVARPDGRSAGRRRALVAGALVAASLVGYGVADAVDVVPGVLTLAPAATSGASSPSGTPTDTPTGSSRSSSGSTAPETGQPPPTTLATLDRAAARPATSGLAKVLGPLVRAAALGPGVGLDVRDGHTGDRLYAVGPDRAHTPASTAKLLAAAALASALDLTASLPTTVVSGTTVGEIVLVAGGDTLLADGVGNPEAVAGHAGLADLATATAAALRAAGTTAVRLSLDDTRARGPAYAPAWKPEDIARGLTGPVAMLGTVGQRAAAGHPAVPDPAAGTAALLRTALIARGITVASAIPRRASPTTAVELARVESAPVGEVLAVALDHSDNPLTEALARYAAVTDSRDPAGAAFPSVAGWIRSRVASLGVDMRGVTLVDASGLSLGAGVPARVLADVLALATTGALPALAGVVAQLPVAAVSGTLSARFRNTAGQAGAGLVRAKTGTLTGVSSLAGTVVDTDGRLLVFSVLADAVPKGGTSRAREALDVLAATLATCGCR